jgi:hypothetical protein
MAADQTPNGPPERRARPSEQEAVRTTIVGGRPPGSGKPVGPIPRGIEVLIKKAAIDPEFKVLLLAEREAAALQIDLALDPAEAMMLRAAPAAQLEAIIARTTVAPNLRSAFLGRAAAVMLVALGAGTLGCQQEQAQPAGESPDRPAAKQSAAPPGQPQQAQPAADARPDKPPAAAQSPGVRPDRPQPKPEPSTEAPKAEPAQPPMPMAGVAPDVPKRPPAQGSLEPTPTPPQPQPPGPPAPTGIRPDRPQAKPPGPPPAPSPDPPRVTGIRPDRPPIATDGGSRPDRPEN